MKPRGPLNARGVGSPECYTDTRSDTRFLSQAFLRVPQADGLYHSPCAAKIKLVKTLLKRNKQNLNVRPSAPLCTIVWRVAYSMCGLSVSSALIDITKHGRAVVRSGVVMSVNSANLPCIGGGDPPDLTTKLTSIDMKWH